MNNKYYPIELHSHTYHSDGEMTAYDLIVEASDFGYAAIFITDHNTNSAFEEVKKMNLDSYKIKIHKGMELTSFYGHVLILGNEKMYDFTKLKISNLEAYIEEIKSQEENIAVGIAHPYAIGNPICTGCNFEFKIHNLDNFNYLEIYNSGNPLNFFWNQLAYEKWVKLINEGRRYPALVGRDWHALSDKNTLIPISMIKADEDLSQNSIINSIKNSHSYVTFGPIFKFDFKNFDLGDLIKKQEVTLEFEIERGEFANYHNFSIEISKLLVINNEKIIDEIKIDYKEEVKLNFLPEPGNFRFELLGEVDNKKDVKLLITSPVYVG